MAHEAQKSFNESPVELQQKVRLSRRGYDGQGCLETWTCYLCFVMYFGFVLRGLNPTKFPKQFDTHCRVLTLGSLSGIYAGIFLKKCLGQVKAVSTLRAAERRFLD